MNGSNPTPAERERFEAALNDFRNASNALANAWQFMPGDAVDNYPAFLPSFDEADAAIHSMRLAAPRALTHDQLQGLAALADAYSKGAHSEDVASVTLQLRRDGLADVYVNGQAQDFPMDEYGNAVNAR